MPEIRHPRPLLVTFHCGVFFVYLAVFLMSISHREVEDHFNQMGPTFIRDMLAFMGTAFVGYLALWNLRKAGVILLLLTGIPFVGYGFHVGQPILLNYLPLIAGVTCLPLWPVLKTP